jgi:hypothetical protein
MVKEGNEAWEIKKEISRITTPFSKDSYYPPIQSKKGIFERKV